MKGRRQRVVDLLRHESNLMHPANDNVAKPQPKRQVLLHPRDTTRLSGAVSGRGLMRNPNSKLNLPRERFNQFAERRLGVLENRRPVSYEEGIEIKSKQPAHAVA